MTDALTETLEATVAEVAAHEDPVERYHAAREARALIRENGDQALHAIQKAVVQELRSGRTWAEVGKLLGTSGSRAEALASGRKSRGRKGDHDSESTPRADAEEGHDTDAATPERQ